MKMAISLRNSWKNRSWNTMLNTLGENCKGKIYTNIYGTCYTKKSCMALEKIEN